MVPFFDNRAEIMCKVFAQDRLVNTGILPNVQSYKTETGCKAGDKCLFPHHEVDEQPNKKPPKSQLGCASQDSGSLDSQRGRQSWGNPMQKVLGPLSKSTIHSVYAASRNYVQ